jgi:NAD(P)-dependent dehydrogenase (short-subunit alcohol dehydrogenase family)
MKTIVIAGGNSSVGLQSAREFLADGHRVILLGRDQNKGDARSPHSPHRLAWVDRSPRGIPPVHATLCKAKKLQARLTAFPTPH